MKKLTLILILGAAVLANPLARADDDAALAIGGFIAGVLTEKIVDDIRDDRRSDAYYAAHRHNGHSSVKVYYGKDRYRGHGYYHGSRGHHRPYHYHYEVRRVWVSGYWDVVYDRCGTRTRVWRDGYWKRERVKVKRYNDSCRIDSYDYHGRGYGRGHYRH